MRTLALVLFAMGQFSTLFLSSPLAQRPIPPGVKQADKLSNTPLEPPITQKSGPLDPAKLKQEAEELAQLSAGVPAGLSLVAKGQLPKDLDGKLKRIEKLARHLRSELTR